MYLPCNVVHVLSPHYVVHVFVRPNIYMHMQCCHPHAYKYIQHHHTSPTTPPTPLVYLSRPSHAPSCTTPPTLLYHPSHTPHQANEGVIVMACTNIPEALDPALTRPGRFDRIVAVPLPDVRGRQQILQLYLHGKPVLEEVDAQYLARNTPGFSGAELFNMVNEAALIAAKSHADAISNAMLDEARDKVLMGSPRKSMVQSKETRKLTAYHEAGAGGF